jgi:DNA-binding beta-propeller fold protein YncE
MADKIKKLLIILGTVVFCTHCAGGSIFQNIPLTLNPILLANPIAMAASASSNRLYIVNSNNRVLWFDASFIIMDISNPTNPVGLAAISIPNFSGQMILDEARGFVYIPNRQSPSSSDPNSNDNVLRININESSPQFLQVDFIPSLANPFGAWFDGQFLFVAAISDAIQYNVDNFSGFTSVDLNSITSNTGQNINTENTRQLAISPSGANLFVTNEGGNMLIINMAQFTPPTGSSGDVDLGTGPVNYILTGTQSTRGITTDSQFIYVVDGDPAALRILTDSGLAPITGSPVQIPLSSLEVAAVPVGFNPNEVLVDEPNQRAYVSNTGSDDISVIDLNLRQQIVRISVNTTGETSEDTGNGNDGDQPFAMALVNLGGTNYLYVAHFETNLISIINADTLQLLVTFPM